MKIAKNLKIVPSFLHSLGRVHSVKKGCFREAKLQRRLYGDEGERGSFRVPTLNRRMREQLATTGLSNEAVTQSTPLP